MIQHIRGYATSQAHASLTARITHLLYPRIPKPYVMFVRAGFKIGKKVYAADIAIGMKGEDEEKVMSGPPKLLIQIMSLYNYTPTGEPELENKIRGALENGTEVVWLIHTGASSKIGKGVQVMTHYDTKAPMFTGDEKLPDCGFELNVVARNLLDE